jgi:hypothetical protein
MHRRRKLLAASAAALILMGIVGASASLGLWDSSPAEGRAATAASTSSCPSTGPGVRTTEIATAKLIIEFNSTDDDIGVHGAFDDHGWKILCVFDPSGRLVLEVGPQGQLRDLTMAGIFFESREPPSSEFSFAI